MSLAQERHCTPLLPGMYEFTLAYSPNRWTHSAQRRDSCPVSCGQSNPGSRSPDRSQQHRPDRCRPPPAISLRPSALDRSEVRLGNPADVVLTTDVEDKTHARERAEIRDNTDRRYLQLGARNEQCW